MQTTITRLSWKLRRFMETTRITMVCEPIVSVFQNRPIHRCVPKYSKILFFDGITRKFDFINWILDFEEYFNYWNICDKEKVILDSNKLESDVVKWQEDIQDERVHQSKQEICSWQRMKKRLIDFFFPRYQTSSSIKGS